MSHPFAPPTPPWLWSTQSEHLDFGSLGDVRYSGIDPQSKGSEWTFMQDPKPSLYPIARLTGLTQIIPRVSKYEPILSLAQRQMVRNIQRSLDDYIPERLLYSLSLEDCDNSQMLDATDPFGGNRLEVINYDNIPNKWIALPTGKLMNELSITPLTMSETDHNKFTYQWHSTLANHIKHATFMTPIEQICASKILPNNNGTIGSTHIAVRDFKDITFFTVCPKFNAHNEAFLSVELADTLKPDIDDIHDYRPIHVAFNPYWAGEAAVVSAEGHVLLWNAEENNYLTRYHYTSQILRDSLDSRIDLLTEGLWMACDYGAHIRSLLIASATGIELMDIRSSKSALLYTAPASTSIMAFRRPLRGPAFQTFFATKTNLMILDQRFSQRPLLSWPHHHFHHPKGIEILHGYANPGADGHFATLITWSPRESCCHGFEYTTGTGSTPPRGSRMPFAIPTCNAREDLWSEMTGCSVRPSSRQEVAAMPLLRGLKILDGHILENTILGKCSAPGKCALTILQLTETGAVYSQVFYFGEAAEDVVEPEKEQWETRGIMKRTETVREMEKLLKEAGKVDSMNKFKGRISKINLEGLFKYLMKDLLISSTLSKSMSGNILQDNNSQDIITNARTMLKTKNHPITLAEIANIHTMSIEEGNYYPNQSDTKKVSKRYSGNNMNVKNFKSIWADIQQLDVPTTFSTIPTAREIFGVENIEESVEELAQLLKEMYSSLSTKPDETDISSTLNNSSNEQEMEIDGEKLLELMDTDVSSTEPSQSLRELNIYFGARRRAIAALANDLWLSSRIILPISTKPDIMPDNQEQAFKYLFAERNNLDDDSNMHESTSIKSQKIPNLTALSKTLMEDWRIGENPADYIFNGSSDESDEEPSRKKSQLQNPFLKERESISLTVPEILSASSQNIISTSQPVMTAEHIGVGHSSFLPSSQGIPMSMPTKGLYGNKLKKKRTGGF